MSLESTIVLVGLLIFVVATLLTAFIHEYKKPKWLKVYLYVHDAIDLLLLEDDYNATSMGILKNCIMEEFSLTEEQASLCIENWKYKWWFEGVWWLQDYHETEDTFNI